MKTEQERSYVRRIKEVKKMPTVIHYDDLGNTRINESNDRYQERIQHDDKETYWSESTIAPQNRHDSQLKPSIHSYKGRPYTKRNTHSHAPYNEIYNMAVMPDFK